MKKWLVLLVALIGMQAAFADDTANIRIRINTPTKENNYFLCLPNIGCLSIRAAAAGKVYPIYHDIDMSGIYVTNVANNFRVSQQSMPASCNVTVNTNQTITISGNVVNRGGEAVVQQLHCYVS